VDLVSWKNWIFSSLIPSSLMLLWCFQFKPVVELYWCYVVAKCVRIEQFDEEIHLKIRSSYFCIGLQAKYTDARLVYLFLYSPLFDLGRFSVS
jgi:hypothetical protein